MVKKVTLSFVVVGFFYSSAFSALSVDTLLKELESSNPKTRLSAIEKLALHKSDSRVIPALMEIAKNQKGTLPTATDTDVTAKTEPTAKLSDKEVDELIAKAKATCAGGRTPVSLKDRKLTSPEYNKLLRDLKQGNEMRMTVVIDEFGSSEDSRAVAVLIQFLQQYGGNLRMRDALTKAMAALGQLGDPKALDILYDAASMARTSDEKSAAILAIGQIGDPESIKFLSAAVGKPFIGDDAVEALAKLGGYDSVKALAAITSSGDFPADRKAMEVMATLGNDRGLEPLIKLAEESGDINVRKKAQEAIDAVAKLEKKERNISIRNRGPRSMRGSGDSNLSLLEPGTIKPTLGDITAILRIAAIQSLGKTKDQVAAAGLVELMKDRKEKPAIRNAAGKALAANYNVRSLVEECMKPLIKNTSSDIETIVHSAKCLGYLGTDEAVERLIELDQETFALQNLLFNIERAPGDMRSKKNVLIIGALGVSGHPKAISHLAKRRVNFTNIAEVCNALILGNDPSCLKEFAANCINDNTAYPERLEVIKQLGSREQADDITFMMKSPRYRKEIIAVLDGWQWQPVKIEDKCFYYLSKGQLDKCAALGPDGDRAFMEAFQRDLELEVANVLLTRHRTQVQQIMLDRMRSYFDGKAGKRLQKKHIEYLATTFNWRPTTSEDKLYAALSTGIDALKKLYSQDYQVRNILRNKLLNSNLSVSSSIAHMLIRIGAEDMKQPMLDRLNQESQTAKQLGGLHQVKPYFQLLLNSGNETLRSGAKQWAERCGLKVEYHEIPRSHTSAWGK
jgi:HEAT repeat protein